MTESVSFKAYLKRDGQEVEVRRFGVDGGAATSYMYLRSKIQAMFPSIHNDQFQVFWQDSDKDYVRVDSDEELLEALTSSNQQPLKVYVHVSNNNSQGGATGSGAGTGTRQTHTGVVCDGCEGAVVGFRYKCGTCTDFDLCSRCESNGLHPEHFMLRMPMPMDSYLAQNHPKFLRKWFSHPHKFHKRHGWTRPASTRGCGDSQNGAGRCPFSRRGEGPGPAAAFAGVTDMFDFSALMEFIESLGVAAGEGRANPQASRETAAPSAEQTSSQAPSAAQEPPRPHSERRENSPAAEYLNNIGQMVASILDPLGVDVTFDVRTKTSQPQQQQAASATPAQATSTPIPPPTQTTATPTPPPTQFNTTPSSAPAPIQAPTIPTPYLAFCPFPAPAQPTTTTLTAAPATTPIPAPESVVPSASSQTEVTPAATIETQTEPVRERRNSDDWTLINRESPTRSEAMDVDVSRGAKPKTPPPSKAQDTPSPSAPPHSDDLSDAERRRIQEAIDTFRAMGFNFNTNILRDLLKRENCNILSVLEMMLAEKK